jgi:hypothetical protein
MFKKVNPHPKGKKTSDCVVRAFTVIEGRRWIDVYKDLCDLGGSIYCMPNDKGTWEEYMLRNGYKKFPMPRKNDKTKFTVNEFCLKNPTGSYVVQVANHLTVVIDGDLYDSWDCGRKSVYNYYKTRTA